jgi:hypothetical protein
MFLWCLSRGATEGYKWLHDNKWMHRNKLISPIYHKGYHAVMDYHAWRTLEALSIFGMLLTYNNIFVLIGSYMFGIYTIYERALNYVCYFGRMLAKKPIWNCLWFKIEQSLYREMAIALMGLGIMIYGMFK